MFRKKFGAIWSSDGSGLAEIVFWCSYVYLIVLCGTVAISSRDVWYLVKGQVAACALMALVLNSAMWWRAWRYQLTGAGFWRLGIRWQLSSGTWRSTGAGSAGYGSRYRNIRSRRTLGWSCVRCRTNLRHGGGRSTCRIRRQRCTWDGRRLGSRARTSRSLRPSLLPRSPSRGQGV